MQVAKNMAQQWAIFKVGAADVVPGQSDAWAYVLKGRASADEPPSEFEQLAMQRSCLLVLEASINTEALPNSPRKAHEGQHASSTCLQSHDNRQRAGAR